MPSTNSAADEGRRWFVRSRRGGVVNILEASTLALIRMYYCCFPQVVLLIERQNKRTGGTNCQTYRSPALTSSRETIRTKESRILEVPAGSGRDLKSSSRSKMGPIHFLRWWVASAPTLESLMDRTENMFGLMQTATTMTISWRYQSVRDPS
jgi:hypothetical protein